MPAHPSRPSQPEPQPSAQPQPRTPHRLVAGTPQARAVASAGGRAAARKRAERRRDEIIADLVEAAPELTARQRDRLAAVFGA